MHPSHLAELAATLAFHGPALVYQPPRIRSEVLQSYWVVNRTRHDLWHATLNSAQGLKNCGDVAGMRRWWGKHEPLMEEILISEILSRTVAALGLALDRWHGMNEVGPVTDSVLASHLESRHRVLSFMAFGSGSGMEQVVRLNLLRSAVDRWCDLLIGYIAAHAPLAVKYAVDKRRSLSFARDASEMISNPGRNTSCWLLTASMRETLGRRCHGDGFALDENQRIGEAILGSLQGELFDGVGVAKGNWLQRLEHATDETDRMVQALIDPWGTASWAAR